MKRLALTVLLAVPAQSAETPRGIEWLSPDPVSHSIAIGNGTTANLEGQLVIGFNPKTGKHYLDMRSNGDIYINGKLGGNEKDAVKTLRAWLRTLKTPVAYHPCNLPKKYKIIDSVTKEEWNDVTN